jgi:hypothetical protein
MNRVRIDRSNPLSGHCVAVALTLSLLATPIAHGKAKKVKLHNDAEATKKEVLKRIPIGSSIEHARDVMKMSSFKCELMRDELFASDCEGTDSRKGDFLYCDRVKFAFPFFERRWQILIFHANGLVTDVLVCIGLTGP